MIAQSQNVPAGVGCSTASGRETLRVFDSDERPAKKVVCLTGADMRGTIYAIYEFSQTVLGVDPMYLWTDKEPAKRASITLPADFAHTYPSPVFKYRGFFTNDEDLLTRLGYSGRRASRPAFRSRRGTWSSRPLCG